LTQQEQGQWPISALPGFHCRNLHFRHGYPVFVTRVIEKIPCKTVNPEINSSR
jgi:hypothetical protein